MDSLSKFRPAFPASWTVASELGIPPCPKCEPSVFPIQWQKKLARFLLDLSAEHDNGKGQVTLTWTLTHEEIAQIIGAFRETVTRQFADFKKRQLLQVSGSAVIIKNRAGLENLVEP